MARVFREHHLLAVPVLDWHGHMQGIITVDDMVSVLQEEASEDIQKIGGMEVLDRPYLEVRFWEMVRKRADWLAILFVGEMLAATAMGYFEEEIAKAVVLALFRLAGDHAGDTSDGSWRSANAGLVARHQP